FEGAVDHRDFYLTDEEKASNRSIIACVSRAAGDRLVLDL
ncbi:MAG: oxidoreductase, partial [Planifilum fulgidum]